MRLLLLFRPAASATGAVDVDGGAWLDAAGGAGRWGYEAGAVSLPTDPGAATGSASEPSPVS